MLPLKVSIAYLKCECSCHHQRYRHEGDKDCCIICAYCKIQIKIEYYALHKTCHETLRDEEEKCKK